MSFSKPVNFYMRILHRYIGFFLAGIMAVYAISGFVLIFRNTDFLKKERQVETKVGPDIQEEELGRIIKLKDLRFAKSEGDIKSFDKGTYNTRTGVVNYTSKELPFILGRLTHLHKASTKEPLYFLNMFFAVSLLFFVISSFWMFRPKTRIFRKGLYFTIAGVVLTLILLFV